MEYTLLGPTGVSVSKICLGTATFGVSPDAVQAQHVVRAAPEVALTQEQLDELTALVEQH